jgi:hypothetical protein
MEDATRYDLLALAEAVKSRSGGMFALGDRGLNIIEGDFVRHYQPVNCT